METCCRAALHRLVLAGRDGRPRGLRDQPCLDRLVGRGLATDGPRVTVTPAGIGRHRTEILRRQPAMDAV